MISLSVTGHVQFMLSKLQPDLSVKHNAAGTLQNILFLNSIYGPDSRKTRVSCEQIP